jgi:putative transposase
MKRSKFTDAQMAFILRRAEEGAAVGEVCRKGVSRRPRSTTGAKSTAG